MDFRLRKEFLKHPAVFLHTAYALWIDMCRITVQCRPKYFVGAAPFLRQPRVLCYLGSIDALFYLAKD